MRAGVLDVDLTNLTVVLGPSADRLDRHEGLIVLIAENQLDVLTLVVCAALVREHSEHRRDLLETDLRVDEGAVGDDRRNHQICLMLAAHHSLVARVRPVPVQ